jgi:hypothetical protein
LRIAATDLKARMPAHGHPSGVLDRSPGRKVSDKRADENHTFNETFAG